MSSVFVSDMYFGTNIEVDIRDRVALREEKSVKNKFDLQMIETGASGTMRFEYIKRENDKFGFENEFISLVYGIERGEIRFGSDKNRGFGRLTVEAIAEKSFDKDSLEEWKKFNQTEEANIQWLSFENWAHDHSKLENHFVSIKVPLRLTGGISIRRYSTKPDAADFEHLTCNEKPVIPGSSWNGAVRSDAKKILTELGCKETAAKLDEWFGFVEVKSGIGKNTDDNQKDNQEENDAKKAKQSMIVFGESILEGAKAVPMTRNKINRFTGGTVVGALYSEIAYFGGTTTLEILIKKDESGFYKPLAGLISLVIKDIVSGYVAVGGQTAVGRGIFAAAGEAEYKDGQTDINLKECLGELVNIINGGERK